MLRINTGRLKGKRLKTLPGKNTRPTLDKTRGVIFDTLRDRYELKELQVVDLFAGSGALGIEAYSNGAPKAIFIENDTNCFKILRENIKICEIGEPCTLINRNSLPWLEKQVWSNQLNLFLIDPPYHTDLLQRVIDLINIQKERLRGSLLVIERDSLHRVEIPSQFDLFKTKKISRTTLDFLEIL